MLESSEKLNNQAIRLAAKGQFPEAIACLKRAITMENQNYLLWFNLAVTYRDAGELAAARKAMECAYRMNPYDDEVIETLANLCYTMHCYDDAKAYGAAGLLHNPDNPRIWNTVGVVYFSESDYISASEAFEHAITLNPYYYDAMFNLRDTYEELGNKAGYEECAERLKNLKPGDEQ